MFLISLLFTNPIAYVLIAISVLFGITIHEYFHAWAAYMLGDDTAKNMGRLTVNPLAHFDPILTSMIFIFGVGSANPVPINTANLKYGRMGVLIVSLAGIVANFIFAAIAGLAYKMFFISGYFTLNNLVFAFLQQLIIMNLVLLVFNLIPIPPLDGSKILLMIMPKYGCIYRYFSQNQLMGIILAIMFYSFAGFELINFFYDLITIIV